MTNPPQDHLNESTWSVCPSCAVGCSIEYDGETGRATGAAGAPVNREGRLCSKGINAFAGLDDDERLTQPLARIDGDLEPVLWAEAYERIETAFDTIIDDYGPDALAFLGAPRCTNEENYLFGKLARVLGTNNIDNRARICHQSTTRAMTDRLGSGAMTNSLADLAAADAFLVAGSNPAAQQPIAFNSYIRPAVNDGATLIHIDPRENRTTRAADIHLAPRPGADALVATLLGAVIVEEGLIDRSFIAERTTRFEAFESAMADIDIDEGAERAGVAPEKLRTAARAFGRAERAAVVSGTGIEGDDHEDTAAADALLNLVCATGNLGKRGAGMNPLRGLTNEQGANDIGSRPTTLPGYESVADPDARARIESEWGVEPPAIPGLSELDAVRAFGSSIRGAFVLAENPAVTELDTERVARNLDALDFLLVEEVFPSETTEHADVVLPASAWAEKSGTVTNLDRQVQRLHPFGSPPGNAKRDFEILRTLGSRLTDAGFDYEAPSEVFAELKRVNPLYAGMEYERIDHGGQRWPLPAGAEEGTRVLHADRFMNGQRCAPFVPVTSDVPGSDDHEHELVLLTRRQVNESSGGSDAGETTLRMHPDDASHRAVGDGDTVVVENDHGRVTATARVTERVRERTVFMGTNAAEPLFSGDRTRVRVAALES